MNGTCDELRDWIAERSPRERVPSERLRLHLEACIPCRELEERDRRAWAMLDEHPAQSAPPGFLGRVVRAALGEASGERLRPVARRVAWFAAAALLLGILALWTLWKGSSEEKAAELARLEAESLPEDFLRNLDLLENLDLLADEEVASVLDLTSDEVAALRAVVILEGEDG